MKEEKTRRTRNFATMVYPESSVLDWREVLQEQFIPCFISPLHNKDTNPTGEPKKPHYHILIMFDSVKTIEQAREVFSKIGGVGCEKVNSVRGYARYLCHLDNPEKFQYDIDDVVSYCGADYMNIISLVTDKYVAIADMIDFCVSNHIISYAELLQYCRLNRNDWFRVLCDNGTVVMKEFLKSLYWTNQQKNLI